MSPSTQRLLAPALALATLVAPHLAQDTQERAQTLDRIVDESLARGEAHGMLGELCRVAPHRVSGSEGSRRAIEWARDRMEALGFQNVRLEPCEVNLWERGDVEELVITAPESLAGERLPILALGGSIATPKAGVEAPVVVVRSFRELEALDREATEGSIVLFAARMDETLDNTFAAYGRVVPQRVEGAIRAARVGAVAALVRSITTEQDDVPHTGAMRYAKGVECIPGAAVSPLGSARLEELVEAGVEVRVRLRLSCARRDRVPSFNVVSELVGRELPDEVVLVGAHLDGWDVGEGAHDDGAGVVQALEVLRLLGTLDRGPRRTVRCVLYANEENGLAGADAYAREHAEELDRHVLAIESDRGGYTPRGISVDVSDEGWTRLEEYVSLLSRTGATRLYRGSGGADIAPLRAAGVPLAGLVPDGQRYFDLHHSTKDVFEAVHPRELQLGAAAMAGLAWLAAEAREPIPRTGPDATR